MARSPGCVPTGAFRVFLARWIGGLVLLSVAVGCRGAFVPRAPSGVSAEPQSRTVVLLSWRYEPGHEYTIVEISRRAENEQYRVVGFMSGRINTLLNTGLRPDTRYFFRLRACQGRRCSEYSREAIGEPR